MTHMCNCRFKTILRFLWLQNKALESSRFLKFAYTHNLEFHDPVFLLQVKFSKTNGVCSMESTSIFFTYLELRAYLNVKFPMDFHNRRAHHCGFESFINIKESPLIIFLSDGDFIIPTVQMRNGGTENHKCQIIQWPLF